MKFTGSKPGSVRNLIAYVVKTTTRIPEEERDEARVIRLYDALDGEAMDYANSVDFLTFTFEQASSALTRKYCPRRSRSDVVSMLAKCQPTKGEEPKEYVTRLYSVVSNAGRQRKVFISEIYNRIFSALRFSIKESVSDRIIGIFDEASEDEGEAVGGDDDDENTSVLSERGLLNLKEEALAELVAFLGRKGKHIGYLLWDSHKGRVGDSESGSVEVKHDGSKADSTLTSTAKPVSMTFDAAQMVQRGIRRPGVGRLCPHCKKGDHSIETCWDLHPELRPRTRNGTSLPLNQ